MTHLYSKGPQYEDQAQPVCPRGVVRSAERETRMLGSLVPHLASFIEGGVKRKIDQNLKSTQNGMKQPEMPKKKKTKQKQK